MEVTSPYLSYKGFDFAIVFNGVGKRTRRHSGLKVRPFEESFGNVPEYVSNEAWRPGNTEVTKSGMHNSQDSQVLLALSIMLFLTFWLYNASYFRECKI